MFTANIRLTISALRAVREAGLEMPGDLELVGFDDLALAGLLRFPVTIVTKDVESIGRHAFDILMDVRQGKAMTGPVLVPPGLVVR